MFERFSEKARRVIFFARYEASQWGESYIQPTHLLLGLIREDKVLAQRLLGSSYPFGSVSEELQLKATGEKVSTTADLPLSQESKRVLAYAAEESALLGHPTVDTGHFYLGLLRQPGAACAALEKKGLTLAAVREALQEPPAASAARTPVIVQIVATLRAEFQGALVGRLTPELEPAVVYSLRSDKAQ